VIDDDALLRRLAAEPPPPATDRTARVLAAAAPILVVHARRASVRAAVRPVLAALVPLPFIVAFDVTLVRSLHALLATVLPETMSTFVAANYALLLALLVTATYAAVPLLVDRQLRGALETSP